MKFEENKPNKGSDSLPEIRVEQLPSQFKAYEANSDIMYVPYTYGETMQFIQSKYSVKDRVKFVLKGIRTSFNKNDLCLDDVFFIDILRKLSTYGSGEYSIPYDCDECEEQSFFTLSLAEEIVKNKEILDFAELEVSGLPVGFDTEEGNTLEFAPLTVGRFFELIDSGLDDEPMGYVAAQCVSSTKIKDAYKSFFDLSYNDGLLLQTIGKKLKFGIKPIEVACSHKGKDDDECGHVNEVEINGLTLIGPFRDGFARVDESRICFGKGTPHESARSGQDGLPAS